MDLLEYGIPDSIDTQVLIQVFFFFFFCSCIGVKLFCFLMVYIDDLNKMPIHKAIKSIHDAHAYSTPKVKSKSSKAGPEPSCIRSVTSALFLNLDEEKIITSGSSDGSIKLWDVRAGRSARVLASTVFEAKSGKRHGIADMKIDSSGTRLFSACKDNSVYMHYLADLTKPALRFSDPDYMVGFDNRISLSPDDRFLLSGSVDKDIFVWEVDYPQASAYKYEGHTQKVTGVSWNRKSVNQVNQNLF
jgi:denticleless